MDSPSERKIESLQPGAETDRLVAEALGLGVSRVTDSGICMLDRFRIAPVDVYGEFEFCPSTRLDAAFWAEERADLFREHHLFRYDSRCGKGWAVMNSKTRICIKESVSETPALAICRAILKLKGYDGQSDG